MTRFLDVPLSKRIQGYPVSVAPMFSTQIVRVDSGSEQTNQRWADPLREISIPEGMRDHPTFEAIKRHWLVMSGPARVWPWRDPTDFASRDLEDANTPPTTNGLDQVFGIGDGVTVDFQLQKLYNLGVTSPIDPDASYSRPIYLPVLDSLSILIDGADPTVFSPHSTFTVTRYGGVVTFNHPPPIGAVLSWGGLFDIIVRFESDDTFKGMMQTYKTSGFADIPLTEVQYCND